VAKKRLLEYRNAPAALLTDGGAEGRVGLVDRLKTYTDTDADLMPPSLMRKYIAYARTYVQPTLSTEAKKVNQSSCSPAVKKHFAARKMANWTLNLRAPTILLLHFLSSERGRGSVS
jgi:hypothetical protein